jgi:hypothetical protein
MRYFEIIPENNIDTATWNFSIADTVTGTGFQKYRDTDTDTIHSGGNLLKRNY